MLRVLMVALAVAVAACGPALARLDASDMRDLNGHAAAAKAEDKSPAAAPSVAATPRPSSGWLARPATAGDRNKTVIAIQTGALVLVSTDASVQVTLVQQLYLAFVTRLEESEVAVIAVMPETCALAECGALEPEYVVRVAHAALASRSAEGSKAIVARDRRAKEEPAKPDIDPEDDSDVVTNPPIDPVSEWLEDYGTFLLGLVGTLLAGITTWFTVAHIRHQIRTQPAGAAIATPAPAAPLVSPVPTGPKRRRARSASTPASRRRSREAQQER